MDAKLIVQRRLPDGDISSVYPFHFCIKGLESATLCRDEEDYDAFVKYIYITALKCNVIVIIHTVVSNHAHVALLARCRGDVDRYGVELKRVQSMWVRKKYGDIAILHRANVSITAIDTLKYARNVFAYIPKNAFDNGVSDIISYRWGGCRAMFAHDPPRQMIKQIKVCSLTTRDIEKIFHTGADLSGTDWLLDEYLELEPRSACDYKYFEMIYNNDQSFFLRMTGTVNDCDIRFDEAVMKMRLSDSDFYKSAESFANQWFGMSVQQLSPKQKAQFLKYLGKKLYLTIPQVARCLKMERDLVRAILGRAD